LQDHYLWELIFQWLLRDMQFCMLHYWFASSQQVITNTLLCSWFLVSDLIFSCKNFLMCCICFNFPTKSDCDGSSKMIENICWISFSLNNKISWTTNRRLIYNLTFRLSLWWISFSNIRGRKKTFGKEYWLEWIMFILSWSSYNKIWTGSSKDN